MKLFRSLRLPLASLFIFSLVGIASEGPDPGQIEYSVGKLLETGHYSKRKLDDSLSKLLLKNYLEELDYNHLFFTQKDVDGFFQKDGTTLDDDIFLGNPKAAYEIYDVYKKRVEDRVEKVKALLNDNKFNYTSDRTIEINRQKAPWPKDEAAADDLWRDRVEGEMLQEELAQHKIDPPLKVVTRRYDQVLRNLHEQTKEDVIKIFLNTLAQTYDPHSEYMSRSELENFAINMRLSLIGIGAVLRSDEGYARIMELVPGGPAARDGKLKVGDRVRAVAQGDKDFVETVDMKLDKVVEMIRGKKDSIVRLQVIPRERHRSFDSQNRRDQTGRDQAEGTGGEGGNRRAPDVRWFGPAARMDYAAFVLRGHGSSRGCERYQHNERCSGAFEPAQARGDYWPRHGFAPERRWFA